MPTPIGTSNPRVSLNDNTAQQVSNRSSAISDRAAQAQAMNQDMQASASNIPRSNTTDVLTFADVEITTIVNEKKQTSQGLVKTISDLKIDLYSDTANGSRLIKQLTPSQAAKLKDTFITELAKTKTNGNNNAGLLVKPGVNAKTQKEHFLDNFHFTLGQNISKSTNSDKPYRLAVKLQGRTYNPALDKRSPVEKQKCPKPQIPTDKNGTSVRDAKEYAYEISADDMKKMFNISSLEPGQTITIHPDNIHNPINVSEPPLQTLRAFAYEFPTPPPRLNPEPQLPVLSDHAYEFPTPPPQLSTQQPILRDYDYELPTQQPITGQITSEAAGVLAENQLKQSKNSILPYILSAVGLVMGLVTTGVTVGIAKGDEKDAENKITDGENNVEQAKAALDKAESDKYQEAGDAKGRDAVNQEIKNDQARYIEADNNPSPENDIIKQEIAARYTSTSEGNPIFSEGTLSPEGTESFKETYETAYQKGVEEAKESFVNAATKQLASAEQELSNAQRAKENANKTMAMGAAFGGAFSLLGVAGLGITGMRHQNNIHSKRNARENMSNLESAQRNDSQFRAAPLEGLTVKQRLNMLLRNNSSQSAAPVANNSISNSPTHNSNEPI